MKLSIPTKPKHQTISPEQAANPGLFEFLKQDYYPYVDTHCQPTTLVSCKNALSHFLRICRNRKMNQYKRIDLKRYKQYRHNKEGIRKTTINIEIRSIKAAFNLACNYVLIDKTPFKGKDFLFDVKPNRRPFTKKELAKLFEACEGKPIGLVVQLYSAGDRSMLRPGAVSVISPH